MLSLTVVMVVMAAVIMPVMIVIVMVMMMAAVVMITIVIVVMVPAAAVVMVIVIALGAFIMNKTYIGRQFYAVGSNEEAARLSGLRVQRVRVLGYVIAGFLAALSGIVLMSRVNSG